MTVSSYPEDVKITISHLVTIMGGKYTTSLGKKNSHLLIRAAAGPKFAGCASRGVIPVTADWLIESAHAGEQTHLLCFNLGSLVKSTCSLCVTYLTKWNLQSFICHINNELAIADVCARLGLLHVLHCMTVVSL